MLSCVLTMSIWWSNNTFSILIFVGKPIYYKKTMLSLRDHVYCVFCCCVFCQARLGLFSVNQAVCQQPTHQWKFTCHPNLQQTWMCLPKSTDMWKIWRDKIVHFVLPRLPKGSAQTKIQPSVRGNNIAYLRLKSFV